MSLFKQKVRLHVEYTFMLCVFEYETKMFMFEICLNILLAKE